MKEVTPEMVQKYYEDNQTELDDLLDKGKLAFSWSGSGKTTFLSGELFKTPIRYIDPIRNPHEMAVQTAATNGKIIMLNPMFCHKLSLKEMIFVLAHELWHKLLLHCDKNKNIGRNKEINNIALDVNVNATLQMCDIGVPVKGGILMDRYSKSTTLDFGKNGKLTIDDPHEKSADEIYITIYDFLKDKLPKNEQKIVAMQNGKEVGPIDQHDQGGVASEEDKQEAEQALRKMAIEGKLKGTTPGWLVRVIDEMFKPIINWKREVQAFISPQIKTRQSYKKPHRNSSALNIYLPHYKKEGVELTVAIDTSGSIGEKEMNYFVSEMESILRQFPAGSVNATLMLHHVNVYNTIYAIKKSEVRKVKVVDGGTSHMDVYDKAKQNRTKLLVLFTDGVSSFPQQRISNMYTIAINVGGEHSRHYYPSWIRRVIDIDIDDVRKEM